VWSAGGFSESVPLATRAGDGFSRARGPSDTGSGGRTRFAGDSLRPWAVANCQRVLYVVNVKGKHPDKDVAKALKHAEAQGWTVKPTSSGHSWGQPCAGRVASLRFGPRPRTPAITRRRSGTPLIDARTPELGGRRDD